MFEVGEVVQFKDRRKKNKRLLTDLLSSFSLPPEIIKQSATIVGFKNNKKIIEVEYLLNNRFCVLRVPTELLKPFELEHNHPLTRIFL